jgi:hypothetical protein
MKIRVFDSDGDYKGGLFKTDVFHAMKCRVWHAPPHPDYRESLIDIAGKGNPCYDSSWFRLQLAKVPDISGPSDGSDDFDANSLAYRLSPDEANQWLLRYGFTPPSDLLELLGSAAGSRSSAQPTAQLANGRSRAVLPPLPDAAGEVWEALRGRMMTAKQLATMLDSSADAVRKRLTVLARLGRVVLNQRGAGYYRPDAMPSDSPSESG